MVNKAEHGRCGSSTGEPGHGDNISISTYISAQLKMIADGEVVDEGFYDKASTNPSSPESVQTVTEEF